MENISSTLLLKQAIIDLELKKTEQGRLLKEQFNTIKENLKPSNIIHNTFDEVKSLPNLKLNILGAILGLSVGYFSKRLIGGTTGRPFRRLLGNVLQLGITAVAAKPNLLQTIGQTIVKRVFTKKNSYEPYHYN